MKRFIAWLFLVVALAIPSALAQKRSPLSRSSKLPCVPHAVGFGSHTYAGSGRNLTEPYSRIYLVTSLTDGGPGSLRECIEGQLPRTCVFARAGVIELSRDLKIRSPYITIAGQTAPYPGITIVNAGIRVQSHDALIQHIAIRPGDSRLGSNPRERDALEVGAPPPAEVYNVFIDHVSLTWAVDENFSTAYPGTHDVTISHSIISEGLYHSIHPKGPHSKGILIGDGSRNITMTRNLLAFNEERNPYLKPDASAEFINNVVYGWGPRGGWSLCNLTNNTENDLPVQLTFVGNVYQPAPGSARLPPLYAKRMSLRSSVFALDNAQPRGISREDSRLNGANLPPGIALATAPPLHAAFDTAIPSSKTLRAVLRRVGSRPYRRARSDARIIREVLSHKGTLKDCTTGCRHPTGREWYGRAGASPLGIPDNPHRDDNGDGYTNLENWLHRLSRRVERARPPRWR